MNDLNELAAVERLGTVLDPPTATPPDALRQRLLSTVAAPAPRNVKLRLGRRLALGGALAAAFAAAFAVPYAIGERSPEMTPAARVLRDAAARAQRQPDVTPRPDQFIYHRTIGRERVNNVMRPFGNESWFSVDGSRGGMMSGGPGRVGGTWPGCTPVGSQKCTSRRLYRPDLPTDTERMLDYLYRGGPTEGRVFPLVTDDPDELAFAFAGKLLGGEYVPPAAQRAIFEALARIPGVRVVGDVTDDAGRAGVAVALPDRDNARFELIFDRSTHQYLGSRVVVLADMGTLRAGDLPYSVTLLKVGIVDRLGEIP